MSFHIRAQIPYLGVGLENVRLFKIRCIFLKDLFNEEKQGLFLFQPGCMVQYGPVQVPDRLGDITFIDYRFGEIRHIGFPGNLFNAALHHLRIDIHRPVIQDFPVYGCAVMVVSGVE